MDGIGLLDDPAGLGPLDEGPSTGLGRLSMGELDDEARGEWVCRGSGEVEDRIGPPAPVDPVGNRFRD
jgi:hypothetical protein